jgi:hypothetical protein
MYRSTTPMFCLWLVAKPLYDISGWYMKPGEERRKALNNNPLLR